MARMLALIGIVFLVAAGVIFLLERMGGRGILSRFGHLPGDIVIRKPGFVFSFPLVSGILLSIVLSLLLSFLFSLFRR
jgi:hypothetical protein